MLKKIGTPAGEIILMAALGVVVLLGPMRAEAEQPPVQATIAAAGSGTDAFSERLTLLRKQSEDFQRRRAVNREAWLRQSVRTTLVGPTTTLDVVVEKVVDGHLLYSQPYDVRNRERMLRVGFREVARAEDAGDKTIFQGRVYAAIRMVLQEGLRPREVRTYLVDQKGKPVTLTLQRTSHGQLVVTSAKPGGGAR